MQSPITVVVGGAGALADALAASGAVDTVHRVDTTSALRTLIATTLKEVPKDQLVFLFADNMTVDIPPPLDTLIQKLTGLNYRVVILELTPRARDLVAKYPAAARLNGPFTVNVVLGALEAMGAGSFSPVPGGDDPLSLSPFAPVAPAPVPSGAPAFGPPPGEFGPPPGAAPEPSPPPSPPPWAVPSVPDTKAPTRSTASPWETSGGEFDVPGAQPATGWPAPAGDPVLADPFATPRRPALIDPPAAQFAQPQAPAGTLDFAVPPVPAELRAPGFGLPPGASGGPPPRPPMAGAPLFAAQPRRRRGMAIAVAVPKGGAGKTTVSLNLGCYLGLTTRTQDRRVVLVDVNFQQADISKYLGVWSPTVIDLMRDPSGLSVERITNYLIARPDLGVSLLLGPASISEADPTYINGALYTAILHILRQLFDYIVIDTPVAEKYHDIFADFVLPQADALIVPVNPNYPTLMNTELWLRNITSPQHAGGEGFDPQKAFVVLNQARTDVGCNEDQVKHELAQWQFIGSIPDTAAWKKACNEFEIIANKNFSELNYSFAQILYAVTHEQTLLETARPPAAASAPSAMTRLRRILGKKS